jgi:2-dehydro-3-deoxyglucarate aldolase/4-hydroxy-2-oxoheptanedioate aldolase
MNENAYRVRAERGEVPIGTGLDFARIDMEHSPFSIETVADMAALARAMDFPMVCSGRAMSRRSRRFAARFPRAPEAAALAGA